MRTGTCHEDRNLFVPVFQVVLLTFLGELNVALFKYYLLMFTHVSSVFDIHGRLRFLVNTK